MSKHYFEFTADAIKIWEKTNEQSDLLVGIVTPTKLINIIAGEALTRLKIGTIERRLDVEAPQEQT